MGFLFGDKPKPAEPARMPTPDDAESRKAAARARAAAMSRSGRSSTILSRRAGARTTGEAGTTAYKNSLLGQAG